MVLAAGLGTRLRPLTDNRPKALVEVAGRTMLQLTLARLREFGISDVIVNVHHYADMVVAYLEANDNFGMQIEISREDDLLDTGGGVKKAAHFFLNESGSEPFLLHNVDILSNFDLHQMLTSHLKNDALATLAVQKRKSSRLLLFDDAGRLHGRDAGKAEPGFDALAFAGIHVIAPRLLMQMEAADSFSIIDTYVRLQAEGIYGFRDDAAYWCDLGKPENVEKASRDIATGQVDVGLFK